MPETRVNTFVNGAQIFSNVAALADGGWIVHWNSLDQDGSLYGVYSQRYSATGAPVGIETRVHTYTTDNQTLARVPVLALENGGWAVVWTSYGQDGDRSGAFQRIYDANGLPTSVETPINTYTPNEQIPMHIMGLPDGGWMVAVTSNGQDGDSGGLYLRKYNADGTPDGAETRINTTTAGYQQIELAAQLADGGWLITWNSAEPAPPGITLIYQQRYDADGNAVGTQTLISSHTAADHSNVIPLADGGWVVTWDSLDQDIYQRRFDSDGVAISGPVRVSEGLLEQGSVRRWRRLARRRLGRGLGRYRTNHGRTRRRLYSAL